MAQITWYKEHQLIRAIHTDGDDDLRNFPMLNKDILVYKGATTPVLLEIRRTDRKSIVIDANSLYFLNVLSHTGDSVIIRKQFDVVDPNRGRMQTSISALDIDALEGGRYYYSVSHMLINDPESNEYLLKLSDTASHGEFIIDTRALPIKRSPYVQNKFTEVRTYRNDDTPDMHHKTYVSSRLPISESRHVLNLEHSDYLGKVILETTTSVDPFDQESWNSYQEFEIDILAPATEIVLENIHNDIKYVRAKFIGYDDNEGTISRLSYI